MPENWLEETKKFFFAGAMHGWAGGNDGQPIPLEKGTPGMEDWRQVIYRDASGFPGYRYIDRWGRDPDSGKPSGHTLITHWDIPVWVMWCGGEPYENGAIPFLREALQAGYRENIFRGGRGPCWYEYEGLRYANAFQGDFARFQGSEEIRDVESRARLGGHTYSGMSLVFLSL
jgi:hypothetical protein